MVEPKRLAAKIEELLENFYRKRIESLTGVKLLEAVSKKNIYLYQAVGTPDGSRIVEDILRAFVSSSDETLFGQEFFEPLAKWIAEHVSKGEVVTVGGSPGVDIQREYPDRIEAIAVKSGPKIFNSQSRKKQIDEFNALRLRLMKIRKQYDPIVLYCYGRKKSGSARGKDFAQYAGQACWEFISGDVEMFVRISEAMGKKPDPHWVEFQQKFNEAKNRCTLQFLSEYCPNGQIDWVKLVRENSGKERSKK